MSKKVAVFLNANGSNYFVKSFLELFQTKDQIDFMLVSLGEKLSKFSLLSSELKKQRIEEILQQAAMKVVEEYQSEFQQRNLNLKNSETLTGRFPKAVEDWLNQHSVDYIVKQALMCDNDNESVSKGDIALSRHIQTPLLLLSHELKQNKPILVGLPATPEENLEASELSQKILKHASYWAKKLKTSLKIVHAWELFAESVLNTRLSSEELHHMRDKAKQTAQAHIERSLEKCQELKDLDYSLELFNGDPTRVLLKEIQTLHPTLIILGSEAHTGLKRVLLGNTAETIVRCKSVNTLIVR